MCIHIYVYKIKSEINVGLKYSQPLIFHLLIFKQIKKCANIEVIIICHEKMKQIKENFQ